MVRCPSNREAEEENPEVNARLGYTSNIERREEGRRDAGRKRQERFS